VLKILQYLHGLKPPVLHRDIKPNNLILGRDKRVYLVDFGAVQNSAAVEGVTFTVVGTSGYAPLEQFWGQAVAASDLYALGASLIHLLTGISPADLPQRELRIQFRDKVSINSQFLNWIEALNEPDLELRFQTADQALNALKENRFVRIHQDKIKHPDIIQRTPNTKIKIKESADKISIYIPSKQIVNQKYIITFSRKFMPIVGWLLLLIPLNLAMSFIEFRIVLTILELWSKFRITYNGELIVVIFGLSLFGILAIPFLYFRFSKYILNVVKSILKDIKSINKIGDEYLIECDRQRMVIHHQYISKHNNCYSYKRNALKSTIKEIGINALENQVYIKVKWNGTDLSSIRQLAYA
jgi:hypothetical protein